MSVGMKTWACHVPECSSKADGIGKPVGLVTLGWWVDLKPDGDFEILCPAHYPDGIELAKACADWSRSCLAEGVHLSNKRETE